MRDRREEDTVEGCVKMEAEKSGWNRHKPRVVPAAEGEAWDRFSLRASRRIRPCPHLDFTLLASRTGRGYIPVV